MYAVIPHTVRFTRPGRPPSPRVDWQVVDVSASTIPQPANIVASCRDEGFARRICAFLNGENPHAEHWQAEAEFARRNADAMESRWQATLDFANAQTGELRHKYGLQKLRADMLRDQLAEAIKERDEARDKCTGEWSRGWSMGWDARGTEK